MKTNGKQNCWDHMKCGREPGGARVDDLGVCPATTDEEADGLNDGHNGGRICWAVAGTFCGGEIQGSFAEKRIVCSGCEFFKQVKAEQGKADFEFFKPGQQYHASHRRSPFIGKPTDD